MKSTFISWTHYNRRSDMLAHHLGATMHHISYGQHGNLPQIPKRYTLQALRTWQVLRRERPDVIFIQNPPIITVLLAFLYAQRYGAGYVIDSHTAAFLSPKWRWSLPLHRRLSRNAVTTIVTNKQLRDQVQQWGCHASVLGFTPAEYPAGEPYPLDRTFNIAVISTGAEDEPLDVVFEAARQLPDTTFYVTGDAYRIAESILARQPPNCRMTGYLAYGQYIGLLRNVDAVIDLTTRDQTLLLGAFEAVSLEKPLIVSDWPILRSYFSQGTVHIPNTVEGVCEGVRQVQRDRQLLESGIVQLHGHLQAEWARTFTELQGLLAQR